jgi:urea transport system substrate-binding protein
VIVNTINGDSNAAFFRTLRKAGVSPTTMPTLSFSIAENEVRSLGVPMMIGDYAAWNYFESLDRPERRIGRSWGASVPSSAPSP